MSLFGSVFSPAPRHVFSQVPQFCLKTMKLPNNIKWHHCLSLGSCIFLSPSCGVGPAGASLKQTGCAASELHPGCWSSPLVSSPFLTTCCWIYLPGSEQMTQFVLCPQRIKHDLGTKPSRKTLRPMESYSRPHWWGKRCDRGPVCT